MSSKWAAVAKFGKLGKLGKKSAKASAPTVVDDSDSDDDFNHQPGAVAPLPVAPVAPAPVAPAPSVVPGAFAYMQAPPENYAEASSSTPAAQGVQMSAQPVDTESQAELKKLREENAALRGEVNLLKFKVELLVDMVTLANLDCDKMEGVLSDAQQKQLQAV